MDDSRRKHYVLHKLPEVAPLDRWKSNAHGGMSPTHCSRTHTQHHDNTKPLRRRPGIWPPRLVAMDALASALPPQKKT